MYKEPVGHEMAGNLHSKRLPTAYETFMEEQGIPIFRGLALYDVRQQALAPWKRMGGRGAFIHLDSMEDLWGMYLVEVPAGGVLNPERHIYEEVFLVIEGHGTTEVWRESAKRQTFEWQPGTNFAVPINTAHRLVNATSSPALLLVCTAAPPLMNIIQNQKFIFDNPFNFSERYDESEDYFKPREQLEAAPGHGRAMLRSSVIPDAAHCYLPLDNNRGPGHRHLFPDMANNTYFMGFIAEYPSGRYSKAHYHDAGMTLICLRGKGFTLNWPVELGPRPWETGKGHLVKRADYIPGGVVSAAPGGGNWFHQHFGVGKEPLRVRAIGHRRPLGVGGEEVLGAGAELGEGGSSVSYREEDPYVRKIYQEALAKEGVKFEMPDSVYA
ncbi:MAG: cupin domain-containing protein [Chloroflexi bacterium]|nr:cupin domain-containing protein [Chloroflexota bacterium]